MFYSIVIYLFIKTPLKKLLNKTIKDNVKTDKRKRKENKQFILCWWQKRKERKRRKNKFVLLIDKGWRQERRHSKTRRKKAPPIVKGWCEKKGVGSDPLFVHDHNFIPTICLWPKFYILFMHDLPTNYWISQIICYKIFIFHVFA